MADIVVLEATAFSVRVQVSPRSPFNRHFVFVFLCGIGVMVAFHPSKVGVTVQVCYAAP